MEKMLINATQSEEIRVALVKDHYLYDLDIDYPSENKKMGKKGDILKARITRIEQSLDAVFVEYGSKRQGFLPFKEIAPEYFIRPHTGEEKVAINSLLREGQELLVQVDKEERGNKGAALTTFITLAGCYLVLMPNNPNSGGISRRIEGDERDELKGILNALTLPDDMGLIIRTAGVGKSGEELQADLDMLCNQWRAIRQAYSTQLAPCLIHQEGDVIIRSIRDNLRKSISEIIIDDHSSFIKVKAFIEQAKPDFLPNLKLYHNAIPLFNFYQIESQIESAYQREVPLPSGGALVIDRTEALVSIDVNSAKATSGANIEATAFNTNLEAADEIARQLRLRDLSGLIVIDFIDMDTAKNQREIENRLKEALKTDRARIQVGRISRFGLLEMSRQHLRLSLGESAQEVCACCQGRGRVRSIPSLGLSLIRLIEEEALKEKTVEVQVQLPVEMATFIMNEKRDFILNIEKRHQVSVLIVANPHMQRPQYNILRLKEDNMGKNKKPSYTLIQQPELQVTRSSTDKKPYEPAVKSFLTKESVTQEGFLKRVWERLFKQSNENPEKNEAKEHVESATDAKLKSAKLHDMAKPHDNKRPNNRRKRHHSSNPQHGGTPRPHSNNPQHRRPPQVAGKVIPLKPDVAKKKETGSANEGNE